MMCSVMNPKILKTTNKGKMDCISQVCINTIVIPLSHKTQIEEKIHQRERRIS